MLDDYGVHPWQMDRWTGHELNDLVRYHRAKLAAQADEGG